MVFMLTFIASIVFGWFAKKYGFVSMWVTLFNLLFCIYLGVMLTPTIVGFMPAFAEVYYKVLCCLFVTGILFMIIRYITVAFFENALDAVLPDMFSTVAGGVTGFFIMLILLNFLVFNGFAIASNVIESEEIKKNPAFEKSTNMVFSSCNFIHKLAGQPLYFAPADVLEWYKYNPKPTKKTDKPETDVETDNA